VKVIRLLLRSRSLWKFTSVF